MAGASAGRGCTRPGFRLVISVPGRHGPVGRTPRCGADGYAGDESPITPGTQINRVPMTFGTPLSTFATLRLFRRRVTPDRGVRKGRDTILIRLRRPRANPGKLAWAGSARPAPWVGTEFSRDVSGQTPATVVAFENGKRRSTRAVAFDCTCWRDLLPPTRQRRRHSFAAETKSSCLSTK